MRSLKNNVKIWTPMHPVRLYSEKAEYDPIPVFMRLADREFHAQDCKLILS
jgi:hypothetical protein